MRSHPIPTGRIWSGLKRSLGIWARGSSSAPGSRASSAIVLTFAASRVRKARARLQARAPRISLSKRFSSIRSSASSKHAAPLTKKPGRNAGFFIALASLQAGATSLSLGGAFFFSLLAMSLGFSRDGDLPGRRSDALRELHSEDAVLHIGRDRLRVNGIRERE